MMYAGVIGRLACVRAVQRSISVSAKPAIEKAIYDTGLHEHFKINAHDVHCSNGGYMFFRGTEQNREEIRGWEDVDVVWYEEAQRMSVETANVLIPTIRKPGSQIWSSWNPQERTDWVWDRFEVNPDPRTDVHARVNWFDNPWFPAEAEQERLRCLQNEPELYPNIWEGQPDDGASIRKVLPYSLLLDCCEAFDQGLHKGIPRSIVDAGLDVADGGNNKNALVLRQGPVLGMERGIYDTWPSQTPGDFTGTVRRATRVSEDMGVDRLYYDGGGLGAALRGYFLREEQRQFSLRPVLFGGKVAGATSRYSYRATNEEMFRMRNAQMAWALRLRAQRTRRLIKGENVDPELCLFISGEQRERTRLLAQLSQPIWKEGLSSKVELEKRPEEERSPDLFDAACLAFARDSQYGLKVIDSDERATILEE